MSSRKISSRQAEYIQELQIQIVGGGAHPVPNLPPSSWWDLDPVTLCDYVTGGVIRELESLTYREANALIIALQALEHFQFMVRRRTELIDDDE